MFTFWLFEVITFPGAAEILRLRTWPASRLRRPALDDGYEEGARAPPYSLLKLFAGSATAALMACELMVRNAMTRAIAAAAAKIHQGRVIR